MPVPPGSDAVRFAYWVPNVSGGLVTSTIEQRTDWGYDYNRELAVLAENNGFDYALSQVRYMAGYGAEFQHESTSFSLALLLATQRLKVIAAVHPGLWHPAARAMAGRVSDWYFSNGKDFDGVTEQITDVRASAAQAGRSAPKFGLNAFLVARDTEAEARDTLREIVAHADTEAVHGFRDAVQQAGPSTADGKGMWQDSGFEDLVQYNDGFRTGLIGTPEQIAERIVAYKRLGVDLFLLGFLHYLEEVEYFGKQVLPLVRELEAQAAESEPIAARA